MSAIISGSHSLSYNCTIVFENCPTFGPAIQLSNLVTFQLECLGQLIRVQPNVMLCVCSMMLHHMTLYDITQGREVEQRVQQVKEQEWNKIAALQQDKLQLEEELTKAQQQNASYLSSQQLITDKQRDELRQVLADKVTME